MSEIPFDSSIFKILSVVDAGYVPINPTGEVLGHGVSVTLNLATPPGVAESQATEVKGLLTSPHNALLAAEKIEKAGMQALNASKGKPLDEHDVVLRQVHEFEIRASEATQKVTIKFDVLVHNTPASATNIPEPETIPYAILLDIPQTMDLIGGLLKALGLEPPSARQ